MPFFDPPAEDDPAEAEGLARIEAGGIPLEATHRLSGLAASGALFTSGLSVNEYALLHELGPRPLAQVMGASVHQIGWQYLDAPTAWGSQRTLGQVRWNDTALYELETITRAWDQARRRALDRLVEEALLVEADAIVGVHLHRAEHGLAPGSVDCQVTGTAVRFPGTARAAWPAVTDLSAQDFWQLHQAGYAPVGLVATTAVIFVATAGSIRWQRMLGAAKNQELAEISGAVFAARDTARARLLGQARDHRADGVVGMAFAQDMRPGEFSFAAQLAPSPPAALMRTYESRAADGGRSGLVVTFHAAGTAIRRAASVARYPPETVIGLGAVA